MKIYTKTGDKGTTALFGGTRVPKHHIRIESYGTVDELNSYIGLIRDQDIDPRSKEILIHVQDRLFTVGAILATDPDKAILKSGKERLNIPKISEENITLLETGICISRGNGASDQSVSAVKTLSPITRLVIQGKVMKSSFRRPARWVWSPETSTFR